MNEKTKQPNMGINVLKFIAIVLVFLIHETLPGRLGLIVQGIAAMSVPVFFMVSGYFSYGEAYSKLKKRSVRMLGLTMLVNAIYFLYDIAVEFLSGRSVLIWIRENCSLKRLMVFVLTNESPFRGHLWFLGALLYSYLFMMIFLLYIEKGKSRFAEIIRNNQVKCLFLLSVVLLILNIGGGELLTLCGRNIQIPYIRNWLFMGLPFFNAAYCIHAYEEKLHQNINRNKLALFLGLSLVLNIVEVSIMPQSGLYFTTIFVNITAFLLALSFGTLRLPPLIRLGNLADKYGLWVYSLQIIVIRTMRLFYEHYGVLDNIMIQIIRPFAALVITFILSLIPVWISSVIKRK